MDQDPLTKKQAIGYGIAALMVIVAVVLLVVAGCQPSSNEAPPSGGTTSPTTTQSAPPTTTVTEPPPAGGPATTQPPAGPETPEKVRLTGYSFQDNTPPSSAIISMPCLHKGADGKGVAGGTGTFDDPITAAVPGHAGSGVETPACTKFYVPDLKRYYIVEDSGATKVNGIRHFDLYVGGEGLSKSDSDACMNAYTGSHTAIFNPTADHPVIVGPMTVKGGCGK